MEVTVRIEPHDSRFNSFALEPRQDSDRRDTVTCIDKRPVGVGNVFGEYPVELPHPLLW